jgi:hypothetical protein
MFRFHWNHHQTLLQKSIYLYIFVEGPDDDSNGIETCRPSPINDILMIGLFD